MVHGDLIEDIIFKPFETKWSKSARKFCLVLRNEVKPKLRNEVKPNKAKLRRSLK